MTGPPTDRVTEPQAASRVAAILVAAGRGRRFGGSDNKVLQLLEGQPIWLHSIRALRRCPRIGPVVMVIHPDDRGAVQDEAEGLGVRLVDGGRERVDSVLAGLKELEGMGHPAEPPDVTAEDVGSIADASRAGQLWVAIHDAARPLVPADDVDRVIEQAILTGAAILATPVRGTIKLRSDSGDVTTVDRKRLWEALTPQVFREDILRTAYRRWRGRPVTDDAELVERSGFSISLVPGSAENLKITHAEDLILAEAIMAKRQRGREPRPDE